MFYKNNGVWKIVFKNSFFLNKKQKTYLNKMFFNFNFFGFVTIFQI